MATLAANSTGADKDLTSQVALDTLELVSDAWVAPLVELTNLASSAATITFGWQIDSGSINVFSVAKSPASSTSITEQLAKIYLQAGEVLTIYAQSTNSGDNDADYDITWTHAAITLDDASVQAVVDGITPELMTESDVESAVADAVLVTPANKLATDATGRVTVDDKTGYALTEDYDAAKTAAKAGDKMDLVDAPNATAVTALQSGLAEKTDLPTNFSDLAITETTGLVSVDKTGYQLASDGLALVTAWTVDITGDISGSVGSVIGGINTGSGTITTLDGLDTAQDAQHAVTQGKIDTVDNVVDAILVDTGTTLPGILGTPVDTIAADIAAIEAGGGLDAEGVRAAIGLASANLDTQLEAIDSNVDAILVDTGTTLPGTLVTIASYIDTEVAAIKAKTDNLPASPAATGDIPTTEQIATALLAAGDVDGFTIEQTLKLCLAALAGKLSGANGTTITIKAADDSKERIVATVDSNGNRSSITLDADG